MVRIATLDIQKLVIATKACFGSTARVWVFGSRADDTKRGGDIDLYVETDLSEGIFEATIRLRLRLEEIFGEQKIDLVTRSIAKTPSPFQVLAKETGVELSA